MPSHPRRRLLLWGLAAWPGLAVLAVANGILREAVLAPALGPQAALPLSGVSLIVLLWLATAAFLRLVPGRQAPAHLWALGALWLGLTLVFELVVFGLLLGRTWDELLAAFDPRSGNLWPLVLLAVLAGPRVVAAAIRRGR